MSGLSVAGWTDIALAQPPNDLTYTGVSIANYRNEVNTDLLGRHMAPGDAILRVTFTSRTDLGRLAFEKESKSRVRLDFRPTAIRADRHFAGTHPPTAALLHA